MLRFLTVAFSLTVLMSLTCSCASEPVVEPVLEAKLSSIQTLIFDKSCATSSCHSATSSAGNLVLEKGSSRGELVDAFAENGAAKKAGLKRVDPGSPDTSFLLTKVQTISNPDYGQVMPTTSPSGLPAEQLAAIRGWIEVGAKDN